MNHDEFHKLREKLHDVEVPVGADMWKGIEASMRRRRVRRILYCASSAAAVVLLALLLLFPGRDAIEPQQMATALLVPQENNVAVSAGSSVVEEVLADVEEVATVKREPEYVQVADVVGEEEIDTEKAFQKGESQEKESVAEEIQVRESEKSDIENVRQEYTARLADDIVDLERDDIQTRRKYMLAFSQGIMPGSSASVAGSRVMASSAIGGIAGSSHMVEQISDVKYSLPVNVGVQLQFPVGENMAFGVGINYSMLKSKYDCLIDKVRYSVKQKLHYIGVPVNIYGFIAERNNFSFYVNAGVTLEKGIRAVYELDSYMDSHTQKTDIDGVQFSVNAGLGVEYKFSKSAGLYFEPNLVYYTNSDVMYSIRTDQPFQVKADVGFRFHF